MEKINLHDLVENQDNPRTIEPQQMQKLVESILTFPKMMQLRPIVCNENRVILGGNMRFRALLNIEQMDEAAIKNIIEDVAVRLTVGEKQQLSSHWSQWKEDPQVEVAIADKLSEEETDEFIIKDNVYFGDWDDEKLKQTFEKEDLLKMGYQEQSYDISGFFGEDAPTKKETASSNKDEYILIECSKLDKETIVSEVREFLKSYEGVEING